MRKAFKIKSINKVKIVFLNIDCLYFEFFYRRAVAQRCPEPPMKNLISFGGQHQGLIVFDYNAPFLIFLLHEIISWSSIYIFK